MSSKIIITTCLLFLIINLQAQSRISLYGGWTASKIRAIYDKNSFTPGPLFDEFFVNFPFWHTIYMGGEFEYDYKKLRLSTGFTMMAMGAGGMPLFPEYPWVVAYYTFPLLGGYHLKLEKGWDLTVEGGVEIGIQNGNPGGPQTPGAHWGNINVVAAVETEWKHFRLGVRGHLGVTTFRTFDPIIYKHTAVTTYLGYTLWDHAQCKARRLQKQQEKQLE
jgi:hypothetical protein